MYGNEEKSMPKIMGQILNMGGERVELNIYIYGE